MESIPAIVDVDRSSLLIHQETIKTGDRTLKVGKQNVEFSCRSNITQSDDEPDPTLVRLLESDDSFVDEQS